MKHFLHMLKLQRNRGEMTAEESSTAHSALYCPPLNAIGTDISVVPAQQTSLSHIVAALTVMGHKVMVGKINNSDSIKFFLHSQWPFSPLSLLLSLLCLQFFESTSLHPLSTRSSSVLCSVTSKHGSTVSPMVCWEAFHLVSPANLDLCNYACLYVSADLDLCVFFCQTEGFFSLHPFVPPGFLPPLSNLSELRQCLTFFWLCQEVIFSCIYLLYFVC